MLFEIELIEMFDTQYVYGDAASELKEKELRRLEFGQKSPKTGPKEVPKMTFK